MWKERKRITLALLFILFNILIKSQNLFSENNSLEQLKNHVYKLSYSIGNRNMIDYNNLLKAQNYIAEQFKSFGYNIAYQKYKIGVKPVNNIIAVKKGNNNNVLIIGAHYDTYNNPGADDNASGVAVLLELARNMINTKNDSTVKFIAFVNEEQPFYDDEKMGSMIYVKRAKRCNEKISGVIILDMTGFFPDNKNRYFIGTNDDSKTFAEQVKNIFKMQSSFSIDILEPGTNGFDKSDHISFWKYGFKAIMITGTGYYFGEINHTNNDTCDKSNYSNMAELLTGLTYILKYLAND